MDDNGKANQSMLELEKMKSLLDEEPTHSAHAELLSDVTDTKSCVGDMLRWCDTQVIHQGNLS